MSDIEDGEVLSSDEEECLKKEMNSKVLLTHDNNNNIEFSDTNKWDYEQNNIKVDTKIKVSNVDDLKKPSRFISAQRSNDRDRKRTFKSHEHKDKIKKRKSENNNNTEYNPSYKEEVKQTNIPQPKRRILCKYYAAGECKNGFLCAFMHNEFPCKFFHDETTTCRAGNNCKYSHELLTVEMKTILEGFIYEGKDKTTHMHSFPIFNNETFVNKPLPPSQPRSVCLLPTPLTNQPQHSNYDPDFTESYNDIANYPDKVYMESTQTYEKLHNNTNANKSTFLENFPMPGTKNFERSRQNLISRSINNFAQNAPPLNHNAFQRPLHNIVNSEDNYDYPQTNNNCYEQPLLSNDENIIPNALSDRINSYNKKKQLNCKIHAPARFIVNTQPSIQIEHEPKEEPEVDSDFQDALKILAAQIILDPKRRSPSLEKTSPDDTSEKITLQKIPEIDTSQILKTIKTESTTYGNNNNSVIQANEMSDAEKLYIEEMKSLINLDAQFENIVPWKAIKIQISKKQPYILYPLKISQIHDNPLADPRLIGHPVLNFAVKKEMDSPPSSDDDEYSALSIVEQKIEPPEDRKSYLNDAKFRKRKIV